MAELGIKIKLNTTKVKTYAINNLNQAIDPISRLESDADWEKAVNYFQALILDKGEEGYVRLHYITFLIDLVGFSGQKRIDKMADILAKDYIALTTKFKYANDNYTQALFGFISKTEKINQFIHIFLPIRYNNDFNISLINSLLECKHEKLAEKYCLEQIKHNYQEEYDVPYWRILKTIYLTRNDTKKLNELSKNLLPYDFNYTDFQIVMNDIKDDEKRKSFRNQFLAKARGKARSDYNWKASEFIMDLFYNENNSKKMIESIESSMPLKFVIKYFDNMYHADKIGLLKSILNLHDFDSWGNRPLIEKNKLEIPNLFNKVIEKYGAETLRLSMNAIKVDRYYYRKNSFLDYAREVLAK